MFFCHEKKTNWLKKYLPPLPFFERVREVGGGEGVGREIVKQTNFSEF